ncbi:MAG: helix-turn-helix domain-containing protein [Coriobacteriales bacterium]|jgi:prophage maintenance system killer protein/DNA-binding XRE family transcriptional regulator|nr:helix-turn-helix domain-containing protein [Coriobacteriales bacterium]
MQDKFQLTREENVFLAKRRWPDSIYCGMRMENRNVSFPQTLTILEGVNVSGVSLSDVQAILNMRDAWRFVIDSLEEAIDIGYLCQIQEKVAFREALAWGVLRSGAIGISGVSYSPPIPEPTTVEAELAQIITRRDSPTQIALDLFCWLTRSQLFWDGNKRTAMLAANKVLVAAGAGVLLISDYDMLEFMTLLSAFYESGEASAIQRFLYSKAIYGLDTPITQLAEPDDSTNRRTAAWLKAQRQAKGLTQKELAEASGVAVSTIANLEQRQRRGSPATWLKLEEGLLRDSATPGLGR